jgi:benzodiazapine receptor
MVNTRSNSRLFQIIVNLAALVAALILNGLANAVPLGGRTTAEISDSFHILFVPAGYVFAIWGLIYLALIGFAIFQAWPTQQNNRSVCATGWWFAVSCVANGLWILFWQYGYYALTLVVMLILLTSLIVVYNRLAALAQPTPATRWLVHFPFSLYLGWITVATVANASAVFVYFGWNGSPLSPVIWTVAMIAIATGLALRQVQQYRDLTFGGVIVWALIGILVKQQAYLPIVLACVIGVLVIVVAAIHWRKPASVLELAK